MQSDGEEYAEVGGESMATAGSRRGRLLRLLRDYWPICAFLLVFGAAYIPILFTPASAWDIRLKLQLVLALLLVPLVYCIQFLRADLGLLPAKQRQIVGIWGYSIMGSSICSFLVTASSNLHMLSFNTALFLGFAGSMLGIPVLLTLADRFEKRFHHRRLSWHTVVAWGILLSLLLGVGLWFVRSAPSLIPTFTYQGHDTTVTAVAWSPDGKRIASGDDLGNVRIWDAFSGRHEVAGRAIISGIDSSYGERIMQLNWSLDGAHIAVCSETGSVEIWNAVTATREQILTHSADCDNPVSWSPTGNRVAILNDTLGSNSERMLQIWNATTGDILTTYQLKGILPNDVAWSPDGNDLAVVDTGQVNVLSAISGATRWSTSAELGFQNSLAWSASGDTLVVVNGDSEVVAGDYQESILRQTFDAHSGRLLSQERHNCGCGYVSRVFVSVDGRFLAATEVNDDDEDIVSIWDTIDLRQVFVWQGGGDTLAWSPDGQYVASGGFADIVEVWRPGSGG